MRGGASRIAGTPSGPRQPRKICVRKQVSVMPAPDPVHIQHTDIAIVTSSENEDQPRHSPPQAPILMPPPMKSDPTELPSELLVCHEHDIIMFHIGFAVVTLCALIYCCAAVFVTSIFFAALPNVLPLAAPVMTLPFVLTTYIFMTPLVK
eukprot:GDKK01009627.1.p1 GENE.GDKK01009627.1~~GDKK01009627.1.p1  ORF type:complete len:150 (+),score=4.03 GDKK01009627.1:37-486(+)